MKTESFKLFAAVVLTMAALAIGQTAWADSTFQVGTFILGRTDGSHSAYEIGSNYTQGPQYGPISGTEKQFEDEDFSIGSSDVPLTVRIKGHAQFANSSSMSDVTVVHGSMILTFTSSTKYIIDAAVATMAGVAVSGCTVSGKKSKVVTVSIPEGKTFGQVTLTLDSHTLLDFCTIGGIAESYVDDGVNHPVPIVTIDGVTLTQDVDYTVSYMVETSRGTVTVTGTGDYSGSKSKYYGIREPVLSDLHSLGTNIYEIASQRDLDYLSRIVNGKGGSSGNNCSGKTFRQTADIAYSHTTDWNDSHSENNFTPIGGYGHGFQGTYDGYGHTVSGIRVSKTGTDNDACSLGLFGDVSLGMVKNVVLGDAKIEGYSNIGGLVGYLESGTITNCYVYNTFVRHDPKSPGDYIAGYQNASTITHAYYRSCEISSNWNRKHNIFTVTADNSVQLQPPARTGGTVVNERLTTYDNGINLDGTDYYTQGTEIALALNIDVPQGYSTHIIAIAGSDDKTQEVINGSTLTVPDYDITVRTSPLLPVISYIDGEGNPQQCGDYTPITSSSNTYGASGETHWYVVSSDVTISSAELSFKDAHVHLILCDGVTLTVRQVNCAMKNLSIYGQSQGTGALKANASGQAILCKDLTINGGIVRATGGGSWEGILASTTTLGWTGLANRIYVSRYSGTVSVKAGQTFWNGSETLSGTIDDMSKVNGKTLIPYINEVAGATTRTVTAHQAAYAGQTRYWATFYHPYWNFQLPAGAQAFTMGSEHELYRVGDGSIIPAGCAVVIMVESASSSAFIEITLEKTDATATPVDGNILKGTIVATDVPGAHVLGKSGNAFGFFEYSGTDPIPANKAYYE